MRHVTPSLSHRLRAAMARHAAAGRVAFLPGLRTTTYADLARQIDACAGNFEDLPLGQPVGILASRSVETIALFFGIMQAGGCPCFLESGLTLDALRTRMRAVGMRKIVLDDESPALVAALDGSEFEVCPLGQFGPSPAQPPNDRNPPPGLTPDSPAMLLFTSGSTGMPKAVRLTHGNLLCHVDGIIAHTSITAADRLLHIMPLHHTNGVNNQLIAPLVSGASIMLAARFRPELIEEQIRESGATYMTGVPTMYSRVLPYLSDPKARRTLRFLRCGSALITEQLHRQIETAFGVPLIVSYGLSEATCTSTMNPPGARRVGTVGTVLRGQRIRLCKTGSLEAVRARSEGEVCIGGDCVMTGYLGEKTDPSLRAGWLRTGDLGRLDDDGYLSITGRIKDVIIRGGENLSPLVIEDAVRLHPSVRACCVVARSHQDLGEVPVAFIVWRDGENGTRDEMHDFLATRLPRSYRPEVRVIANLPETPVGKIDRRLLRQTLDAT